MYERSSIPYAFNTFFFVFLFRTPLLSWTTACKEACAYEDWMFAAWRIVHSQSCLSNTTGITSELLFGENRAKFSVNSGGKTRKHSCTTSDNNIRYKWNKLINFNFWCRFVYHLSNSWIFNSSQEWVKQTFSCFKTFSANSYCGFVREHVFFIVISRLICELSIFLQIIRNETKMLFYVSHCLKVCGRIKCVPSKRKESY